MAVLFQIFLEVAEVPNQRQCPPQPMQLCFQSKPSELVIIVDSPHPLVPAERVAL
jgi:hypothetical protein